MKPYLTPHERECAAYDAERKEAFKRIVEEFEKPRRRTREMLKWYEMNPSPRTPEEQLRNLRRAIWD